jgi:class 3 adenylate cyclase/tetratricopeptide (TPR) repeat protein
MNRDERSSMSNRKQLQEAIKALEAKHGVLGDAVVEASIAALKKQMDELDAADEYPEQQRKLATILFADIVGSTNIVKQLDPEDALEIMDGSLKRMAIPVEEHGGHITRFMGDGFKAVFGMPKARENDPEMAIRAGLGILGAAQEIGFQLETQWGISDFQVRVGINTGLAALGGITEAEDTVMGSTVNLAKRIESAAPPGGLLVTHNTYRHVRGIFDVEPHDPIEAKGFDEPIPVYRVLGVKPRAFRVQTRGVEGVETRMVGRKAELIALQEAYRNAIEGEQTQVVTVVGEAGVGKSRLLYEFQNWLDLHPDELRFFQGRGRQETQNLPFALLKDMFTFRFQIQESGKASEVRKRIDGGFGEIFGIGDEGEMRAQIIGQLLGFDFSESQHIRAILDDPQQIHDRALMYLAEYFQGMSEQFPVVIFLEDIHWADDSSLDMLNRLARRIPEKPILIVCVARHRLYERRPHWGEGLATHRRLELQPLSKNDSCHLVTEILQKVDQIPDSLQDLVVKGAEGNPFYIEELIKMLVEDGVINTEEEQWQVEPQRLAEIVIPPTLTGVLQARLDALPQDERNTLQQASVVGHIFWDATVEFINNESTLIDAQSALRFVDEKLSCLRARELIYHREESTFTDAAEYTFKHAILRDVTYESVLKRVRKAYHGLVAEWLIQHSKERAGEYTGLIADHLELAGKQEQAAIYLYQAGEGAAKRYANSEAEGYFTRALALTPVDDLVGSYDLLLAREKVLDVLGDRKSQLEDLVELKKLAEELRDISKQADVALHLIDYYIETDNHLKVEDLMSHARNLAQSCGDDEKEAKLYLYWGRSLWKEGEPLEAISPLRKALKIARKKQLHQFEADSLRNLGIAYDYLGDPDQGLACDQQALEIYSQIGDRSGQAAALNNLGGFYTDYNSDYIKSEELYQKAYQIWREIGDRSGEGYAAVNLGWTATDYHDYRSAIEWLSEGEKINREVENQRGIWSALVFLGNCYLYLGDYTQAKSYFDKALQLVKQAEMGLREALILGKLMEFYWTLGDYKAAESYRIQYADIIGKKGYQYWEVWNFITMGLLKQHLGDNQAAMEYSQKALQMLGKHRNHTLRLDALICDGHARTANEDYEGAEQDYAEAAAIGFDTHRLRNTGEALAGLARISLARGEIAKALTHVEKILKYIECETPQLGHPLDGTKESFRIYLTCYHALKANDDPRANTSLIEAYNLLQKRAANIDDEHLRDCFLNNVAVNREIVDEYEALGMDGGAAL